MAFEMKMPVLLIFIILNSLDNNIHLNTQKKTIFLHITNVQKSTNGLQCLSPGYPFNDL